MPRPRQRTARKRIARPADRGRLAERARFQLDSWHRWHHCAWAARRFWATHSPKAGDGPTGRWPPGPRILERSRQPPSAAAARRALHAPDSHCETASWPSAVQCPAAWRDERTGPTSSCPTWEAGAGVERKRRDERERAAWQLAVEVEGRGLGWGVTAEEPTFKLLFQLSKIKEEKMSLFFQS